MFSIDGYTISISRGDTASFIVTETSEHTFGSDDRAVFTVKDNAGEIVMERYYALDTELGNGKFLVELHNSDTDDLNIGAYSWDVRYVLNPYWENERIVDGDNVITPFAPQIFNILGTVGEV